MLGDPLTKTDRHSISHSKIFVTEGQPVADTFPAAHTPVYIPLCLTRNIALKVNCFYP